MRHSLNLIALLFATLVGCLETEPESTHAPTGAKGVRDEFGRLTFVDEECGRTDSDDYGAYFQNALFRDGSVARDRLWMVDGTHIWAAPLHPDPFVDVQPVLEAPFVGPGNAVAATEEWLAIALVNEGAVVFPSYRFEDPVSLPEIRRALDVAAVDQLLAVAAGDDGVLVYSLDDPAHPTLRSRIEVDGYASGVRWRKAEQGVSELFFAACSRVGVARVAHDGGVLEEYVSTELAHRNAKDAHGNGENLIAANNGGGVWYFSREGMEHFDTYELSDVDFYANSVAVDDAAYVAAGNRELLALSTSSASNLRSNRRDPLAVLVEGDLVYGFGNFRDIGERTVIRAEKLSRVPDRVEFGEGFPVMVEAAFADLVAVPAGDGEEDQQQRERLTIRKKGEKRVYEAASTEDTWRLVPDLQYYGRSGTYTVTQASDGMIYLQADGATSATSIPTGFPPEIFEELGFSLDVRALDGFILYGIRFPGADGNSAWVLTETGGRFEGLDQEDPGQALPSLPLDAFHVFNGQLFSETELGRWFGCVFVNEFEEAGVSRRVRHGVVNYPDGEAIYWCSRQIDPHLGWRRPLNDVGAQVFRCFLAVRCEEVLALRDSGLVSVARYGNGLLGLVDDRIAFTTGLVYWADSESEASSGSLSEVWRHVQLGRPAGWKVEGEDVRVWMTDGSVYSYRPPFEMRKERNAVADMVLP